MLCAGEAQATLQSAIRLKFRQSYTYLDEHSVLKGMGNLVTRKGDMRVAMQLPAAHIGAVDCQPDAKLSGTSLGQHMPRLV